MVLPIARYKGLYQKYVQYTRELDKKYYIVDVLDFESFIQVMQEEFYRIQQKRKQDPSINVNFDTITNTIAQESVRITEAEMKKLFEYQAALLQVNSIEELREYLYKHNFKRQQIWDRLLDYYENDYDAARAAYDDIAGFGNL